MNGIKMPAAFAAIDENEMVYLNGGSITDTGAWKIFLNVGTLFNYVARIFSAGSSIVNNVNVIVTTIQTLRTPPQKKSKTCRELFPCTTGGQARYALHCVRTDK